MKTKRRHKLWLLERVASLSTNRVDREAGVIRGVKVLGLASINRRRYLPEAVEAAAELYEGASVRANHPKKATDQRGVEEVFGWLEGVEFRSDGLYADLHVLNPKTELAESVFLAAEKNPKLFGLSHNVQGDTERDRDGTEVVYAITEVRSVDLVADPATTNGLYEGRGRMKLKAFLESVKLGTPARRKLLKATLKRLWEADVMDPMLDAPMDAPPAEAGEGDHHEALRGGFEAACMAVIQDCLAGGDCKEGMKKLKEMLTSHEKLTSTKAEPAATEPVEEGEDEEIVEDDEDDYDAGDDDDSDEGDDKPMSKKESVELKLLRKEKKGRELCEAAGVVPDSVLLESLAALPDEAAMKRLIEREKKRGGTTQTTGGRRPQNQPVTEGRRTAGGSPGDTRTITDGKGLAGALKGGVFSGVN